MLEKEEEEKEDTDSYWHLAVAPTRGQVVQLVSNATFGSWWERDGGALNERALVLGHGSDVKTLMASPSFLFLSSVSCE